MAKKEPIVRRDSSGNQIVADITDRRVLQQHRIVKEIEKSLNQAIWQLEGMLQIIRPNGRNNITVNMDEAVWIVAPTQLPDENVSMEGDAGLRDPVSGPEEIPIVGAAAVDDDKP